jgi:spermidine synthase
MAFRKKIVYAGFSKYSNYKVVDQMYNDRPSRVLYGVSRSPQSGVAFDDEPELLFHYNQRFLEIAESMRPKSILCIGGGAFTLPTTLFNRFPDVQIDVVEIDPLLPTIGYDYFDLPRDERLKIITMDGRTYVDGCKKKYDLIILDAFSGYDIPRPLLTKEAVQAYKKCLAANGLIAVNFISTYYSYKKFLTHEIMATFESVFSYVDLYQTDHENDKRSEQNLLLIAGEKLNSLDYLQASPIELLFQPENVILYDNI